MIDILWLLTQDSYTLHKLPRRTNQPKVEVTCIDEQWNADLCDMSSIANFNDNKTFLLTVIDVFSKKTDAEPVENKSGKAVTAAFEAILNRADHRLPQNLQTDKGNEFWNTHFCKMCKSYNIHLFSSESAYKACVAERAE